MAKINLSGSAIEKLGQVHKEKSQNQAVHKLMFWCSISLIILANIAISAVLIPALIVLNSVFLYFVIIVSASSLGVLYRFLLVDIIHIEQKHHILAAIIVPSVAIVSIAITTETANNLAHALNIATTQNTVLIALTYVAALMLPYMIKSVRPR